MPYLAQEGELSITIDADCRVMPEVRIMAL